jgi:hypothetical protein
VKPTQETRETIAADDAVPLTRVSEFSAILPPSQFSGATARNRSGRSRPPAWGNAFGYQLLEVTLTCLLIGFLASLAWPAYQQVRDHWRLSQGSHLFLSLLEQGRTAAIGRNLTVQIRVSDEGGRATIAPVEEETGHWLTLPRGVLVVRKPNREISFYSRGTAAPGGTFVLGNSAGEIRIVISPAGRIRWQRG